MASRGVNKVILVGNMGQDPETRHSAAGVAITNITLATSETWKDKNTGQPQERTEWHRVVFFNRLGEIAAEYLRKGSKVYVEGTLRTRKWQDKEGQDRYTTEIVANEMQMLDSRNSGQDSAAQGGYAAQPNNYGSGQQPAQPQQQNGYPPQQPSQQPPQQQGAYPSQQPPSQQPPQQGGYSPHQPAQPQPQPGQQSPQQGGYPPQQPAQPPQRTSQPQFQPQPAPQQRPAPATQPLVDNGFDDDIPF